MEIENHLDDQNPTAIDTHLLSNPSNNILKMMSSRAILRASRVAAPRTIPRAVVSQSRSYAVPAADAKPPVSLYGVDGTYASALVCHVGIWTLSNRKSESNWRHTLPLKHASDQKADGQNTSTLQLLRTPP